MTLPAVHRLGNFLNSHSRLPDSDNDMVLMGERYTRTKRDDEDKKAKTKTSPPSPSIPRIRVEKFTFLHFIIKRASERVK